MQSLIDSSDESLDIVGRTIKPIFQASRHKDSVDRGIPPFLVKNSSSD